MLPPPVTDDTKICWSLITIKGGYATEFITLLGMKFILNAYYMGVTIVVSQQDAEKLFKVERKIGVDSQREATGLPSGYFYLNKF